MIPIYSRNPARHHVIGKVVAADHEIILEWNRFARRALCAEVAIAAIEETQAQEDFGRLQRFTARHATSIVLLLDDDVRDETLLGRTSVASVVRFSDVPRKLTAAIVAARNETWRHNVAAAFAASESVPALIKKL